MRRPQPKILTDAQLQSYEEQAAKQTGRVSVPQTVDSEKYPMFEMPVDDYVLVYIPRVFRTEVDEDGEEFQAFNYERAMLHQIRSKGSYMRIRCAAEISGIEGFDGTCALCDGSSEAWDLFNKKYEDVIRSKGFNIEDKNEETVKEACKNERTELNGQRAVQNVEPWLVFPMWVIKTEKGKSTPAITADGQLEEYTLMWHRVRENVYRDKWFAPLKSFADGDSELDSGKVNPAGRWFMLDYRFEVKTGSKPTGNKAKMMSAKALSVSTKNFGEKFKALEEYFDANSQEWTPKLAKQTVYDVMPYATEDLAEIADEALGATRDQLAAYSLGGVAGETYAGIAANGAAGAGSAEETLSNFGAQPVTGNMGTEAPAPVAGGITPPVA